MKPPPNSRRQKGDMTLVSSWKHKILEWPVNHTVIWGILLGACAGVTVNHKVILGILLADCAAATCEPHCYLKHSSVHVSWYTILHVGKRTATIMLKILGATPYNFSHTSDQAPGICASLLTNPPPQKKIGIGSTQHVCM